MDPEALAKLLVRAFEEFVDESVVEMTLKGRTHGVWLATLFSWLLPETTHVTVGDRTILGGLGMKLTVEITIEGGEAWELEIFKSDGDVTKYVFDGPRDEIIDLHRLPLGQAKNYFDDHYCSAIEDAWKRRNAIHAMGELAGNLTIFFSEHGRLFLSKDCCKLQSQRCLTAPIVRVMSNSSLSTYSHAMSAYGWDSESQPNTDPTSQELKERLEELAPQLREEDSPEGVLSRLDDTVLNGLPRS